MLTVHLQFKAFMVTDSIKPCETISHIKWLKETNILGTITVSIISGLTWVDTKNSAYMYVPGLGPTQQKLVGRV
jgi:hypothetical protein